MKYKCKHCKLVNSLPGLYCEFCGKETGFRKKKYAAPTSPSKETLGKTETNYPTGDEVTRAFTYQKKKAPIILSVLLVFFLLAGAFGASWHFGLFSFLNNETIEAVERYYNIVDGRQIETVVLNSTAAKTAVNEVKDVFGMKNAEEELTELHLTAIGGDQYYRLKQTYQDLDVYGRSLVVETDSEGHVITVSGNYCPISDLSITPGMESVKANKKILKFAKKEKNYDEESLSVSDNGLVIYAPSTETAALAYSFSLSGASKDGIYQSHLVLLDADNGKPLYQTETQHFFSLESDGEKESHIINVEGTNDDYQFVDTERNIQVYSAVDNSLSAIEVISSTSTANKAQATDALYYASYTYDFYLHSLERFSYDNNGGALTLITDIRESSHTFDRSSAFSSSIAFYPKAANLFSDSSAPDVVAHEFTHLVLDHTVGFPMGELAPSIAESYADIMGNIVDQSRMETPDETWALGEATGTVKYEMSAPSKNGYPETISSFDPEKDAHENASILARSAYLMWHGISYQGLTEEETAISNLELLGKLWYRSMLLLPQDADFESCGATIAQSAHDMYRHEELTAAQKTGVLAALETVGIIPDYPTYETSGTVTLQVYDAVNSPYTDISVSLLDLSTYRTQTTDSLNLSLSPGSYLVSVRPSDSALFLPSYTVKLVVGESGKAEVPIYTWYNAKDYIDLTSGAEISFTGKMVGENWTDADGDTHLAWILAMDEPVSVRFINESGHANSIYNDQVAITLTSDTLDFSQYNWQYVTVTGSLVSKYSDIHRRDLCLENVSLISPAAPPTEQPIE